MTTALKLIAGLFLFNKPEPSSQADQTIYRVQTNARNYCGRIVYQDNMLMKLKSFKPKPVKILKSNIERITIVQNESTKQYYEWQKAQRQQPALWKKHTYYESGIIS